MNQDNNNEHQIVNPQMVDLNAVQVNNNDNMLNRERSNIVSASIQANDAIDEKKALDVNNEIKIKKINPIVKIAVIIMAVAIALVGVYFVMKLVNKAMTYDDPVTTTTTITTTTPITKISGYTTDLTKIRKYQSANHILILAPKINNGVKFLYLQTNENGIINAQTGDYNLIDEGVTSDVFTLLYGNDNLVNGGENLFITDTEMKSYKGNNEILIINGTPKYEYAMYINETSIITGKFTETESAIVFEDGTTFNKDGMTVSINGHTLEYVY